MSKLRKMVFVGLSGGVDSSVAAYILKKQNYEVVGVFLRCFNVDGCAEKDAEDARRVAEKIGIPFYVWDFEEEYKRRVVQYMIEGYRNGITPNPDIECNREIKFGLFLDRALSLGADYVATGHYVRLGASHLDLELSRSRKKISKSSGYTLVVARDENKDQSYFLWTLTQKQLTNCLFPIGEYLKPEVREIARKVGLQTAEKKDSQGICFLGKVTLDDFLKQYLPEKNGEVLNVKGEKLGQHNGAHFYTIGQRHIGIKYQVSSIKKEGRRETKPVYVVSKDVKKNIVVVGEEGDLELFKKEIELQGVNFINQDILKILSNKKNLEVWVRVRYRQPLVKSKIKNSAFVKTSADRQKSKLILEFEKPQRFVAVGQSAVFYSEKGEMLGGGIIVDSQ